MLNVSQNFKNDIVSTNQTLKPVLLITDADDNVIFTLTQDQDELFNIDGNSIKTINSIRKVSNVRISTDYDSKILKINSLRCTLYNYYNINTKLSEYINTTTVGKNLYMFYKSPTTNVINLTNEINKADCALVYRGEINRITFNDKSITLSIEDKTQVKIADKIVPYVSVDKLPLEQRDRLLDEYKDSDNVVPMTFGYVDKAPVLPYLENNNDRVLNVLLDFHPTASNYKTGRIPKIGKTGTNSHFCLYVKKDDDYIILDHNDKTVYQQNIKFSKFQLFTFNFTEPNYLLPSLRETNDNTENLWSYNGFTQRLVDSVYASDGSILDAKDIIDEQLSDDNFTNIKSINDNAGYEKKWYRHSGLYSNQSDFKYSDNDYKLFENGYELFENKKKGFLQSAKDYTTNTLQTYKDIGNTVLKYNNEIGTGIARGTTKLAESVGGLALASLEKLDLASEGSVQKFGDFFAKEIYPRIGETETLAGGFAEGISQFLTPGLGYYKLFGTLIKAKGVMPFVTRALAAEAATVGTAQVPMDPNFVGFIAQMFDVDTTKAESLSKEIFNYIATPETEYNADTVFKEKMKAIIGDSALGPVGEGVMLLGKLFKGLKKQPEVVEELNNSINLSGGSAMNPEGPLAKEIDEGTFSYKAELEGPEKFDTVMIMDSIEPVIIGTGKNNKVKVEDIINHFDQAPKLDIKNPDDFKLMVDQGVKEVTYQLDQKVTGAGWYDKDIKIAM